jgi:hypothetical protein
LLAVLLAACSAATSTTVPAQSVDITPTLALPSTTATVETALQATVSPSQTLAATPLPVVTSRGPHLEATDPKTVSMTSGGLQFVEFFEFW